MSSDAGLRRGDKCLRVRTRGEAKTLSCRASGGWVQLSTLVAYVRTPSSSRTAADRFFALLGGPLLDVLGEPAEALERWKCTASSSHSPRSFLPRELNARFAVTTAVPDAAKVSAASSCGSGSTTVNRVALAAESGYLGR